MVNQVVLKYFKDNMAKHSVGDLRSGALKGGYSKKDIDEVVVALKNNGNTPRIKENPVAAVAVVGVGGKTSGVKWMKFAGILGIIFLVFGLLNLIGAFFEFEPFSVIGSFSPWVAIGLFVVLIILSCFYFFGFVKMGNSVDSKLLKVSAIMNIVVILLIIVLFGLFILSLEYAFTGGVRAGFLSSLFGAEGMEISFLIIGVLSLLFIITTRIMFSISLIRIRKKIKFAIVGGILGLVSIGFFLFLLGMAVYLISTPSMLFGMDSGFMWIFNVFQWSVVIIPVIGLVELLFESLALFDGSKKFEN